MDKTAIAIRVEEYSKKNLQNVPFDKGLPILRKILWEIADEEGVDGAEILKIYMEWKTNQK